MQALAHLIVLLPPVACSSLGLPASTPPTDPNRGLRPRTSSSSHLSTSIHALALFARASPESSPTLRRSPKKFDTLQSLDDRHSCLSLP
jgi:hypothetical protein